MKTSELEPKLKVITISTNPIAGFIIKWSCLGGKSEKNPDNVFVKIRKLNGVITYSPASLIQPFINGAN
jgi:hypothetical protein